MNFFKNNKLEIILGLILGIIVSVYAETHRTPHEPWYIANRPEPEVYTLTDEELEMYFSKSVDEPEEVVDELAEQGFVYIPMCELDEDNQRKVFEIANEYGIAYTLVLSMIVTESECDPTAVSEGGDHGLMQINKCNHKWLEEELGITDIMDIEQNIRSGCFILAGLFKELGCGNVNMVLMSYNMGQGNAQKLWNQGIYESRYSKEIIEREIEFSKYIDERMDKDGQM